MKRAGPKGTYAAPALDKAFEILQLLADNPGGATITSMATMLDRSVGELFRIVIVMEMHGYLQKSPITDKYTLAYKLLELAFRATPAQDLVEASTQEMASLSMDTGQSCHLVVANDAKGLIIARKESPGVRGFSLRTGAAIDLLNSCSGNVILAFSPQDQRRQIIDFAGANREKSVDETALERHLETVRERGYDLRKSPITFGVTDISYPIFGFDGSLMAALTIPFLELIDGSQKVDLDAARERLASATLNISDTLGWKRTGEHA